MQIYAVYKTFVTIIICIPTSIKWKNIFLMEKYTLCKFFN